MLNPAILSEFARRLQGTHDHVQNVAILIDVIDSLDFLSFASVFADIPVLPCLSPFQF